MHLEGLQQRLLGATHRVEILAQHSAVRGLIADAHILPEDLSLADRRLRLRFVVSTPPNQAEEAKSHNHIRVLSQNGWHVRILLETEVHHALEYIIIDREVAYVGAGSMFSSKAPNRRVEHSPTVDSLVTHFRQLWYASLPFDADSPLLYHDPLATAIPAPISEIAIVSEASWQELIKRLGQSPDDIFELPPRKFEELVAELLRSQGYEVQITQPSKDGGRDLFVAVPQLLGDFLYLVECKRYAPDRRVGVRRVRELYGVVEQERATAGILVTTSSFTAGAIEFQKPIRRRLSLHDYKDLTEWLRGRSPIIGGTN